MDVRTNVVIKAETKGFDKALRDTLGLTQGALQGLKAQAKSYESVKQQVVGLQQKVAGLAKQQIQLNQALGKVDKGTTLYRALQASVKSVSSEMSRMTQEIKLTEAAFEAEAAAARKLEAATDRIHQKKQAEREKERGAFTQGFLQGAAPGMAPLFLNRGPGMRQQFAGQMLGGALKKGVGGVLDIPFSGLAGVAQALSAIPGGGFVAGAMQNAMGHAGGAMQWQQEKFNALPFLGGGLELGATLARMPGQLAAANEVYGRESAGALAQAKGQRRAAGLWDSLGGAASLVQMGVGGVLPGNVDALTGHRGAGWAKANERLRQAKYQEVVSREQGYDEAALAGPRAKFDKRASAIQAAAAQAQGRTEGTFHDITRAGHHLLGVSRRQALQDAQQFVQAGGGTAAEALASGALQTGFAARTAFGVGLETSGAFLGAERRGGLVGGRGRGAEALTGALVDTLKQGLTGHEALKYLQTIAQGIQSWESTGIEFNKDSLRDLSLGFAGAGIAVPRAQAMAGGLQNYITGLPGRGITGGLDLMLLQKMGGYQGGAGGASLEQAMIALEGMQLQGTQGISAGSPAGGLMRQLMEMGGGGESGRRFLRMNMARMGIQMSTLETRALGERLTGEPLLSPEQRKQLEADQARREHRTKLAESISTPEGLQQLASKLIPGVLRKQASIEEKQLEVGTKMIPAMQTLSETSVKMAETFGKLAGGPSGHLNQFLLKVEGATEALDRFMENLDKHGSMGALRTFLGGN